jgi:hypothetical protein
VSEFTLEHCSDCGAATLKDDRPRHKDVCRNRGAVAAARLAARRELAGELRAWMNHEAATPYIDGFAVVRLSLLETKLAALVPDEEEG